MKESLSTIMSAVKFFNLAVIIPLTFCGLINVLSKRETGFHR